MFDEERLSQSEWARLAFWRYRGAVAFIETRSRAGHQGIGTCFHVGDGVFVTARHVVEGNEVVTIGSDTLDTALALIEYHRGSSEPARTLPTEGPYFHPDASIDIACFRLKSSPEVSLPLGGHFDDWLGEDELVLHRALVLGYPPIPFSDRPILVASLGEINALMDSYRNQRPYFIVSMPPRVGFSGAPVLVAYNGRNSSTTTAVLGCVVESLHKSETLSDLGFLAVTSIEPIYHCLDHHGLLPDEQRIT